MTEVGSPPRDGSHERLTPESSWGRGKLMRGFGTRHFVGPCVTVGKGASKGKTWQPRCGPLPGETAKEDRS